MRFRNLVSLLVFLGLSGSVVAQSVPSPEAFLGYPLGERFTPHHRVVDYFNAIAESSDRMVLQSYGETYEGRPLLSAFVSSPENLARLDEIRESNLRLAGLMDGSADADPVAIVWLSYNVHGNESVSTEAAMATLYDLAGGTDARANDWLAHTLVVIDPCINPDGRERYVQWYNRSVGRYPNANPDALEHHEPWPGGRSNHYWFDLNRDWSWLSQQETQARIALYNAWMPQVHVDFHEQGVNSPYYFAPAAQPYHPAITPWQQSFQQIVAANHARYFDAKGWLYFTGEVFDLFYPGYGDTYPTYNGAIGMTYEQGGSGRAGLGIVTAEGDTLRLSDRIAHHHTTSISTVEASARERTRLTDAFAAYFSSASTRPEGDFKTYVIKAASGRDRLVALATHLDRLGIRSGSVSKARRGAGFDYATGRRTTVSAEPGDLVVSAYQPKSTLARILLEPQAELVDSLTYDITAWSLPYAYGAVAVAMIDGIRPDSRFAAKEVPVPPSGRPYAYVSEWTSPEDAAFLASLYQKGVRVRYATEPFRTAGSDFAAGTLVITRRGNEALGEDFDRSVVESATDHGRALTAVASGLVDDGADFGSGLVRAIAAPRVAVIAASPVSSSSAGEIWHFFDRQVGYPTTLLEELNPSSLSSYDVLVLPSGSYDFSDENLAALRTWIRSGGRLIALERAATGLIGKDGFALKRREAIDDTPIDSTLIPPVRRYADRRRNALRDDVSGAIFRVTVDTSHPLGFGLESGYYTLRRSAAAVEYLEGDRSWNVGVLGEDAHRSGQVGHAAREGLDGVLAFGVQEIGSGAVVYFLDDPLYRGFWYNGRLLFANAVFMR